MISRGDCMAGNYKGNEVNSKDFLEILFALKNNIMKDLNVCEVAQIESISNEIYKCKILSTDEVITAIPLQNLTISQNDVVVILFSNTDFRTNLKRIQHDNDGITDDTLNLHNKSFGIIIGILYHKEETK